MRRFRDNFRTSLDAVRITSLGLLALSFLVSACASAPAPAPETAAKAAGADACGEISREEMDSALWVLTSAEHQAASRQVYALARERLEEALADPSWWAPAEEAPAGYEQRPPAIILDVDETVLNNALSEAELVSRREEYNSTVWNAWVKRAEATALAGVKEYLDFADQQGVAIFYVTNRDAADSLEEPTRKNLLSEGLPVQGGEGRDTVLLKNERPEWTGDKKSRREFVARTHRIVGLFGDDLNDFVSGARAKEPGTRRDLAAQYGDRWGKSWFLLPNPMYGSWEDSLFERDFGRPYCDKVKSKRGWLKRPE